MAMSGARNPRIEPHPDVGVVFNMRRFDECDEEGVAEGCQLTGWWDFPHGGYKHWLNKGRQRVRIGKTARENGDAGIERHFRVAEGEVYRFTSKLRLIEKTGKAKFRLNMSARKSDAKQIVEFNSQQKSTTAEPVLLAVEAEMPPQVRFLSVRAKLHTSEPGEFCEGEIYSMKLERLR